jgi:hypothetical protein
LKSPNFVAGNLLMFGVGMILTGTLALLPSMMQVLRRNRRGRAACRRPSRFGVAKAERASTRLAWRPTTVH